MNLISMLGNVSWDFGYDGMQLKVGSVFLLFSYYSDFEAMS